MKLIVAVEAVESDGGLVAAAVVYPVHLDAPRFAYTDRYGRKRVVGLEKYGRISDVYRVGILRHLKRSALSWSIVARQGLSRDDLMCLAVGRALERLAHRRDNALQRNHVVVAHAGRSELPSATIGRVDQEVYATRGAAPWPLAAAAALAKSPRNDMVTHR